jgi:hypothetical protein
MPYPFAHPAAVIPLRHLMGRFAVPSALVIGSIVPDLWYFGPDMVRADSHGLGGLLWFCLPAGLVLYLAFHLLLKQPLMALLPAGLAARAAHWTAEALPAASWLGVMLSLLAGALTHQAWDALTHASSTSTYLFPWLDAPLLALGEYRMNGYQVLQHGSSALGGAVVAAWTWRKLGSVPAPAARATLAAPLRGVILLALLVVPALAAPAARLETFDLLALRGYARTAGFAALAAFMLAVVAYAALWHLWRLRNAVKAP